jgi:hypothetical protein
VLSPVVFSPSSPLSQPINYYSFRFERDPNLASKRSVEVMWQDEKWSAECASRALLLPRHYEEPNLVEVVNFDNFDKDHCPIEGRSTNGFGLSFGCPSKSCLAITASFFQ